MIYNCGKISMFSANIVGCGKLGKTIAKLLTVNGATTIVGIVNSSMDNGNTAAKYVGEGRAFASINELPKADIYFITTKDDLIEEIANKLQTENILQQGAIVLHCSGSLSSDVLSKVKESKCYVASIHPIKSFANTIQSVSTFAGTYCAFEGDKEAISILVPIFEKIGGIPFPIEKESKKIYHAGGVIANNYLVTLHYHATQCYINAGVDKEIAKKIVSMLMKDALNNLTNLSHSQALTGPIQRGDTNTVSSHTASLKRDSSLKDTRDIYLSMGRGTLTLVDHQPSVKNNLLDILTDESKSTEKNFIVKL